MPLSLWLGIAAALCLTSPFIYSIAKRSDIAIRPRSWFAIHVVGSVAGAILALLHSQGNLWSPPALLLLLLALVIGLGIWIRVIGGKGYAARMGARPSAFVARDPARREKLGQLLAEKTLLLRHLEPAAAEAAFSPQLGHWLANPVLSLRYQLLAERERDLAGARSDAGPVAGFARRLHMAAGVLFLAGLLIHLSVALYRMAWEGGA